MKYQLLKDWEKERRCPTAIYNFMGRKKSSKTKNNCSKNDMAILVIFVVNI